MFEITEEDIKALIKNFENKNSESSVKYNLKDLVKFGLMYLYAEKHYQNGVICPCNSPFDLYTAHTCIKEQESSQNSSFIEIKDLNKLYRAEDCISHCWTGYNLALLTSKGNMQGYFKNEFLFFKQFNEGCKIAATAEQIYIGLESGKIINFNPMDHKSELKPVHSSKITTMRRYKKGLLSASLDGTVFYKSKIKVSNSGVLDALVLKDESIVCICEDFTVRKINKSSNEILYSHKSPIKSLSSDYLTITSSEDGQFAFYKENELSVFNIGCSHHKLVNNTKLVAYNTNLIKLQNINKIGSGEVITDKVECLDAKNDLLIYSSENLLKFRDLRSKSVLKYDLPSKIKDLAFSENGSMIFISTESTPYILNYSIL